MAVESDFIGRKTVEMQMHSCTRKKKSLCSPSSMLSSLLYAFLSLNQNGIGLGNRNLIVPNSSLHVLRSSSYSIFKITSINCLRGSQIHPGQSHLAARESYSAARPNLPKP